ncbi:hypothetical protein Taro_003835, partial [Colocasia esculenta]|nr:hypothetical protein [Colocasia esculenta]
YRAESLSPAGRWKEEGEPTPTSRFFSTVPGGRISFLSSSIPSLFPCGDGRFFFSSPAGWENNHVYKRAPTFLELFDKTHKRKGTDDYVSESARTIAETYDRTMAKRYAEGTPQPDLDLEAWVDAAGGPRKGRVYGFGDSLDTHPVLSSYASLIAPPAYASSTAAPPVSGVEEIRDLIREELRAQLQTQRAEL